MHRQDHRPASHLPGPQRIHPVADRRVGPVTCVRRSPALFWGGRTIRTAYISLAEQRLSNRQFVSIVIRFVARYLLLKFFLLS